jgi:hypothetical protein
MALSKFFSDPSKDSKDAKDKDSSSSAWASRWASAWVEAWSADLVGIVCWIEGERGVSGIAPWRFCVVGKVVL